MCRREWADWREFVFDRDIDLRGLQAITSVPDSNLLVFRHICGSTISVRARLLRHLLPDSENGSDLPMFFEKDNCERHCQSVEDLEACNQPCNNSRDRHLLLELLAMKRRGK